MTSDPKPPAPPDATTTTDEQIEKLLNRFDRETRMLMITPNGSAAETAAAARVESARDDLLAEVRRLRASRPSSEPGERAPGSHAAKGCQCSHPADVCSPSCSVCSFWHSRGHSCVVCGSEIPPAAAPASSPGALPAGVVDRLVELVRLYRGDEDLGALRVEFETLLACDVRWPSPGSGEEEGLRARVEAFLAARDAWFAFIHDKSTPRNDAQIDRLGDEHDAALKALRTALSGRADATKGGK